MTEETMLEYLAARQYGYMLFQRLFGAEPKSELFDAIDADVAEEAFGIVCGDDKESERCDDALEAMIERLRATECNLDETHKAYTRLFVGPAELPAPPWESVYVSGKRMIMQPSTLEIRNAYREQGYIPALYPHVPDDHLALELDFLAALASKACDACKQHDDEAQCRVLEASRAFASEHVLNWIVEFADDVREKGDSEFYACVASALVSFVRGDVEKLEEAHRQRVA